MISDEENTQICMAIEKLLEEHKINTTDVYGILETVKGHYMFNLFKATMITDTMITEIGKELGKELQREIEENKRG